MKQKPGDKTWLLYLVTMNLEVNRFVVSIQRPIFEAMLRHVQAEYPLEACGLLAGPAEGVVWGTAVFNQLQSETAYEMEPLQQIQAMLEIEKQDWPLVIIYHSHPKGPELPSPSDIAQAYYPEAFYLIISLAERAQPVTRLFSIVAGQVAEIVLVVE